MNYVKMILIIILFHLTILRSEFKDFTSSSGFQMIAVEGGTFSMGGTEKEDQKPVHTVKVDSFYIAKYEVTQTQWNNIMGFDAVKEKFGKHYKSYYREYGPNLPVYYINWYQAIEFCNSLSEKEGLNPCYIIVKDREDPFNKCINDQFKYIVRCKWVNSGYRLATEAEWEFAASGGNKSKGYTYSGGNNITEVGITAKSFKDYDKWLFEVGQLKPNELGIHDMSGNIAEYCWDWYLDKYYSESPEENPRGPKTSSIGHVTRGSSFKFSESSAKVRNRGFDNTPGIKNTYGIRLVRNK